MSLNVLSSAKRRINSISAPIQQRPPSAFSSASTSPPSPSTPSSLLQSWMAIVSLLSILVLIHNVWEFNSTSSALSASTSSLSLSTTAAAATSSSGVVTSAKHLDDNNTSAISNNLPNFDYGGFIFFLHVPKTGGTTIRFTLDQELLKSYIDYGFVSGRGGFEKNLPFVERYIRTPTRSELQTKPRSRLRRILFLEIHGRDSPNLKELHKTLVDWKRIAAQNDVPTFFFTILREPISYALSYFNYFHVQRPTKTRHFEYIEHPTQEDLTRLSLFNPQCQFLSRGEFSLRQTKPNQKYQPTQEECQLVHRILEETMDHVGVTESMDNLTLPLLSTQLKLDELGVTFGKHHRATTPSTSHASSKTSINNHNNSSSILFHQLSLETRTTLESMSKLDRQLYNSMVQKLKTIP